MIYTVKGVKDIREAKTKWGVKSVYKVVVANEDGEEFPISLWHAVKTGDTIEGEMGDVNEYEEYKFTEKNPPKPAPKAAASTDDNFSENQNRIARESVLGSIAELFANRKEISAGEFFQYVEQGINIVFNRPLQRFCTAEQRKALVVAVGEDEARNIAYINYGKPYLHLLTFSQAETILNDVNK